MKWADLEYMFKRIRVDVENFSFGYNLTSAICISEVVAQWCEDASIYETYILRKVIHTTCDQNLKHYNLKET